MKFFMGLIIGLVLLPAAWAQDAGEGPVHGELRAVRDAMISAVNQNDVEALLSHLHENVVVNWMNGEVSRGPAEVKAYYERMMVGDDAVVDSVAVHPEVERLADIYENTAVAYGTSKDQYALKAGLEFEVNSRWSATLVKEDGRWKVASFHASANVFDNPILNAARKSAYWAGGIGLVFGIVLGSVIVWLKKRAAKA